MSTPLQPSSPSARQLIQPSPTSPSYAEHHFKKTLLDDVKTWSETKVTEWLTNQSLGRFSQKFIEHNISGAILLDLDYESLKAMNIKTVGERVRLAVAIKALRQECYLAASLAARTPIRHEVYETPVPSVTQVNNSKISKSSETSSAKSLLNRSNSFSRFLGRSDSKRSQRFQHNNSSNSNVSQQNSDLYSQAPSSPRTVQKRNSLEGGIMSMEKVKQTCVKVFGEDGQTRIVNVHTANEAKQIMAKVLHKFGIDESSADSYCIFVGSSTNGEARALSDTELVEICRSTDRPEKERLILRKRHMYPTHEEFKRKGTINANRRYRDKEEASIYGNSNLNNSSTNLNSSNGWRYGEGIYLSHRPSQSSSFRTLPSSNSSTKGTITNGNGGRRRFFGERPPSEIISSNLHSFFPNHNREVLETAGIKAQRLSMTRRNSSLSRSEPRNYRNSVLPELVSVLGVDLDKFLEEEEVQEDDLSETSESSISSHEEEEQEQQVEEEKPIPSPVKPEDKKIESPVPTIVETVATPTSVKQLKAIPDKWMKGALIGRGTFGDVYLGLNPISGELMAVKQVELPVENSATEEQKKSMVNALRREIDLLRDLEHENIVQYLGFQTDESYFCIFLEYVPGGSVAGLLASYGAFQEPLVKSFVRQILKGLRYLHSKDIVHRDIKGANVLVDNKGGVKITDFGISKKVEESGTAAHRPSLQGSIYWMAPEVVKQTQYTRKADIWSLGCMMVEMFTGDHPFPEFSQMQAIFQIGCYTAPNIPPNLSEDAQDFLRCTFRLNHEERPSADELLKHPFLAEEYDFDE